MYVAAISNPLQYSESRQPLDAVTSYLTEQILANDIDKARQKNDAPKSQIHYATPAFQNTTKADLIGGKTNLGAFALCNSHHALAQAVGLAFDDNSILRKYGIKSVSKIFSDKPNYHDKQPIVTLISDWISAMINAHVDVAKDPYINRLNIRKATLNTANLLLRTGKGESTFYFLAQDILIDFANEFDSYSGYYGVELDGQSPKVKAMRHVIDKYQEAYERLSGKQYPINLELDKPIADKIFDINWLRKAMVKPAKDASDTVKANWYKNQLDIMKAFRELEPAARSLSKLTNLSQIDTKKFGNNFALQQNFLMKLATFMREDKMFVNKGSVIKNTFLRRKLLDGLLRPRKFLNKTMLRLTNTFETYRKDVYYLTGQNEYSSDGYVNAITRMMEASYKVKFISQYAASQGIDIASLLYGDNTIVRRLLSLKNDIKVGMYPELLNSDGTFSNALLDSIDAMPKITSLDFVLPDFLQLNVNKSEDHNIDNHIIRAWSELLDSEHKAVREFARDLAVYAMYTSGDAFGKNNIFKYVPESFRESSGYYDSIRKLESNPEELTKYLNKDEIIRSLWWNDDVVPSVSIYRDELDENNVPTRVMIDNIPTDTPLLVDDKLITVPGVLINPSTNYFGINSGSQPIFQPYIKVNLGARNDPRTTMLYKYIGFTMDENEQPVPHYKLVNKLGSNYKGKTLIEPMGGSNPKSMIGANSAYFTFDYRALGITLVTDFRPHTEVFKTDDFTYLESIFGDNAISTENKKPTVSESEDDDITKYLAPGEEANEIIRETIELAKKGLKVTNELGEFFTEEEKELIKQATANKNLFVKSASRRTDPAFFTEELINQLKENAKLPFGHPDRFYVMEIWSKHDGLPMSDLIDACIQYRVAPLVSFSISTLGNSAIEPGVMKYNDLLDAIEKLIKAGKLNPATMTIRIDPLLPGVTKLEDIENVVKRASSMGITKFVSSVMQSYGSSERTSRPRGIVPALATAIGYDWDKYYGRDRRGDVEFRPKYEYAEVFGKHLKELIKKYGVKIESCASNNLGLPESACLDPLAIEKVTGVTVDKDLKDPTRKGCMCYGAHGDMLRYSDVCKSCCAYCYAAQQNPNMEYQYYDESGNLIDSALTRTSRVATTQKMSNNKTSTISVSGYTKGLPQNNPKTDYVFTENAEAYTFVHGLRDNYSFKFPNPNDPKINVSDVHGTNQAGIRTDQSGNVSKNAYGIVVKKFQQNEQGRFVAEEGQFQDTDVDFAMFTSLNEDMFNRLQNSTNTTVVFPSQMALGKAALPLRFAQWLQSELAARFNIVSVIENNNTIGYNGYGLKIENVATTQEPVKVSNAIPTTKIISGGQTGIDRLGLEIGKELGLETGGTTTPGYYTENGPDTSLQEFGVTEITPELQAGRKGKEFYLPRTEQNVINSDGTVYFSTNEDRAGLRATQRFAVAHNKPFLLNPTSQELAQWLIDNNITTLNVAGNRGSKVSPEFDSQVRDIIRNAFKSSVQQDTFADTETINIYAGTNENADLSNFAVRPFSPKYSSIMAAKPDGILAFVVFGGLVGLTFQTVEGAFQAAKVIFAQVNVKEANEIIDKLTTASGPEAKRLGRTIKGLDTEAWDRDSSNIMKLLIKESFIQNPDALQRLLSTGNATLTHTQDKGKWGAEFPRILMEVRDELRAEQSTQEPVKLENLAESWSEKEGWSVEYFNSKVLPRLDEAWQIEFELAPDQSVPAKFQARMDYVYNGNNRPGVESESALDAIVNGERTATTRYESDGNIDYWQQMKVGDVIEFKRKLDDVLFETLKVIVTKPLTKLRTVDTTQQALEFEQFVEENSQLVDSNLAKQVKKEIAQAEKEPKKLVYTFSDGTEVPTPFELNDQQKQALAEIEAFYNSDEATFTLQGYAGTGKTTIMKIFDVYLKKHYDKPLYLAPTHRANAVTKYNNPNVETSTLHSFLGLSPQFDILKDEFDLNQIKFEGGGTRISDRFLIIDESSMIGDKLYDYLLRSITDSGNKALFLGDSAQLRPVNSDDISKVFKQESKVELTKVERTGDNAILKEATRLRNGESLSYETDLNSKGEGVIYTKNVADVMEFISRMINSDEYLDNYSYFKILTATNDNIPIYNNMVRTLKFGKNAPQLVKGELLTCYNTEYSAISKEMKKKYMLSNSLDYVVTEDPIKTTKKVAHTDIVLEGYKVTLKNIITNDDEIEVFIVDNNTPDRVLRAITMKIDELWAKYRELKNESKFAAAGSIVKQINEIQDSFCTMKPIENELTGKKKRAKSLDYGYTQSIHKSQGGTYNNVLVVGGSINRFRDPQEQQQLSYVAITRAKEQVMWTVPEKSNITITTKQQPTAPLSPEIQELANAGVKRQNECK